MTNLTQDCLTDNLKVILKKIGTYGELVCKSKKINHPCREERVNRLMMVVSLTEVVCTIDVDSEDCLTEEQICLLVDKIYRILNSNCAC